MAAKRAKSDQDRPVTRRAFKYRLYPSKTQERTLILWMETLCRLYNEMLERKELIYHLTEEQKKFVLASDLDDGDKANIIASIMDERSWNKMQKWITARRKTDAKYGALNYASENAVLRRMKKAFEAFWRRRAEAMAQGCSPAEAFKRGGYPFERDHNRFNIIEFENYGNGFRLGEQDGRNARVIVQHVGPVRFRLHRPIEGKIKRASITKDVDRWYVVFSCEIEEAKVKPTRRPAVGIVLNSEDLIVTSCESDQMILPPSPLADSLERVRALNRDLSRKYEEAKRQGRENYRSQSWYKTKHALAKLHATIENRRRDYHYKVTHCLLQYLEHGDIFYWKRNVKQLIEDGKGRQKRRDKEAKDQGEQNVASLVDQIRAERKRRRREWKPDARTMIDAGISQFLSILTYKAKEFGCEVVPVELDEEPFIPLDPVKQAKLVLARGLAGRNGTAEPGQ